VQSALDSTPNATAEIPDWLDLPAKMRVVAHGVRIGFGAPTSDVLNQMKSMLPPGARPARNMSVDVTYTLRSERPRFVQPGPEELIATVDGDELMRSTDGAAVLQSLERHLHLHVAEYAPRRFFVHAGVVAWKGKAIVIPGTTWSGKSTLVAALVQAGATYYSDEFALVDPAGRVHPYLKPIQLRDVTGSSHPLPAAKFRCIEGKEASAVGLVLVTRYRRGSRWRPQPVSSGAGMLALLANTVSARRDPKRALQNLTRMLAGACVLKGPRGEAESVAQQLVRSAYLPK
jgi:hypothetical protein